MPNIADRYDRVAEPREQVNLSRIDTIDRYAASEQHRAPLRPPFNNPPADVRVTATRFEDGTPVERIVGAVEAVRAVTARWSRSRKAAGKRAAKRAKG